MNRLVEFLKHQGHIGRERAIMREDVADQISESVRRVKRMAEQARLAGVPILYKTEKKVGGIFLAKTEQEIEEGIEKLNRLALSLLRERSALKRALKERREKMKQRELFG